MVVLMVVDDDAWMSDYFRTVPALLAEFGGFQTSGGREIEAIEGDHVTPDRVAVLEFPDLDSARRFMADDRYRPYREARCARSRSDIYLFANEAAEGRFS